MDTSKKNGLENTGQQNRDELGKVQKNHSGNFQCKKASEAEAMDECVFFLAKMIEKYGEEVLRELEND